MSERIDSLAALRARAHGNPAAEIVIQLLEVPDYAGFVTCINRAVDRVLRIMAENPELRKGRSEDELTIEVVGFLRMLGIEAGHENKVGGHVDIVVRGPNDYLWLAEAKKHKSDYSWLYKGFQQLNTRYSTGIQGHDLGAIIIYSDQRRIDQMMDRWREYLEAQQKGIMFDRCPLNDMAFLSSHAHEKTGRAYNVRHIPLSLYFDPQDKS